MILTPYSLIGCYQYFGEIRCLSYVHERELVIWAEHIYGKMWEAKVTDTFEVSPLRASAPFSLLFARMQRANTALMTSSCQHLLIRQSVCECPTPASHRYGLSHDKACIANARNFILRRVFILYLCAFILFSCIGGRSLRIPVGTLIRSPNSRVTLVRSQWPSPRPGWKLHTPSYIQLAVMHNLCSWCSALKTLAAADIVTHQRLRNVWLCSGASRSNHCA
jgi:hypothetical protein